MYLKNKCHLTLHEHSIECIYYSEHNIPELYTISTQCMCLHGVYKVLVVVRDCVYTCVYNMCRVAVCAS